MFPEDRADAGRQLATRLLRYKDEHPVVLGLPRGGVVLAENRPMMSVFRKSGLPMMTTCSEPGVLEVSLKLVP